MICLTPGCFLKVQNEASGTNAPSLVMTANGKAKAAVTPSGAPPAFFLRVRIK